MIIIIENLVPKEQAISWADALADAPFSHGRKTAGLIARTVKDNEQLTAPELQAQIEQTVALALRKHPLVRLAARPKKLSALRVSRYKKGMSYGPHVDDALMPNGQTLGRTDLSFTLFLNDPASYEGGELAIAGDRQTESFKLDPGHAVLYPSGAIHEVTEITAGERLAVVGWIESLIRDPAEREILADLEVTRNTLFERDGNSAEVLRLSKAISALMRRWSES